LFEHPDVLRSAYADVGDLEPATSLERIKESVHPGALRYYEKHSEQQAAAAVSESADAGLEPPEGKSFAVYFDFDVATFDLGQIDIVQEACGYAATLPSAEFIVAGHADTMGPEPYNDRLSLARAQSVASIIRNDPRFRDALDVIKFGEHRPAVATADEVAEPKNRRVVITVMPGKAD
jgi:outer membrane protein OmpA-like peptidoglycan-associated protein